MFSIERLRALAAVRTHGSIARAARVLHLTPSGMSQQLAKLEREAGQRLLEPDGRTVRLTHAGRVLAGHADRVLAQVAEAQTDLAALESQILGPLRLGGVGSAVRTLLPGALSALLAQHPRLTPTVRDGEAVSLLPPLLRGELDLVMAESWSSRPVALPAGVRTVRLLDERVCLALPSDHPFGDRGAVDLADLAPPGSQAPTGLPWASCPAGTEPHEAILQALRARGVEPDIRYTLAEIPSQLELVASGLAMALVPDLGRRTAPVGVRFLPTEPPLRRTIEAVWRADAETPAIRACVTALTDIASRTDSGASSTSATIEGSAAGADHTTAPNRGST
ncbi:LysR family transcriptional regulator [Nocardiopsis metallicus]|uniref:DNA-binding transcriptional LysR family regulator n=1 Tax=Nocardiopsis metallicus TaxID=179819 RepID=A0A840WR18_9ACTN|nr:LysR family transcriptional regulator [Nocardiopsis metallicus]MBB5495451.1 DNA-binding transcriptional LysR family regulator [Nocardiopsis metallicus]